MKTICSSILAILSISLAMLSLVAMPAYAFPKRVGIILHPVAPASQASSNTLAPSIARAPEVSKLIHSSKFGGLTQTRIVTSSYLRMHESNVLIAIASKVESGQIPKSSLVALAGPSAASALIRTNWSATSLRGFAGTHPVNTPPNNINHAATTLPSWENVQQVLQTLYSTLPSTDYGPQSIAVGELKDGTSVTRTISLNCPVDSTITAKPENSYGGAVQVTKLTSFTGVWTPDTGRGAFFPTIDQQVGEGQSLPATAGQDVSVTVNVDSNSGNVIHTNIEIVGSYSGQAWTAIIPLTATYTILGPINEIIAVPDRDVRCLAGQTVKVPVQLLNVSSTPTRAQVTVTGLSDSVTVATVNAVVPADSTVTKTLEFVVDPQAVEDIGQSLDVVVDAAGLHESHSSMSFSIYDPLHEFDLPNGVSAGGVNIFFATVGIGSDGTWYFNASAANTNQIDGNSAIVAFAFPGENGVGHGHWESFNFPPNSYQSVDMNGTSKWVYDNYLSAVTLTPILYLDTNPSIPTPEDTLSIESNTIQILEVVTVIAAL